MALLDLAARCLNAGLFCAIPAWALARRSCVIFIEHFGPPIEQKPVRRPAPEPLVGRSRWRVG